MLLREGAWLPLHVGSHGTRGGHPMLEEVGSQIRRPGRSSSKAAAAAAGRDEQLWQEMEQATGSRDDMAVKHSGTAMWGRGHFNAVAVGVGTADA